MDKRIVLFIMQVWISLALWGQTSMCGFSITKEDSLRYEGKPVELIKIVNKNGMTIKVTNYAASLAYVSAPDRNGVFEPVVLGLDSLRYYWGRQPKLGATVGRFANRIKNAEFRLDDKIYYLDRNNKGHSIHGGIKGFNLQVFETDTCYIAGDTAVVVFKYLSPDMEGGFPGNLNLSLAYKFTNDNEVILDYIASTDKPTVINLTNHSYFNLTGCKESVLNHCYMIMGDSITPVDSTGVPTGELMPVAGTEYDFSTLRTIKHHVEQLGIGHDEGNLGNVAFRDKIQNIFHNTNCQQLSNNSNQKQEYKTAFPVLWYMLSILDQKPDQPLWQQALKYPMLC